MIKKIIVLSIVFYFFISLLPQERREIKIPVLNEYQIIKCDFHMHTIFSDGEVWPAVRVHEAWNEGLDAIVISDHIEYIPHKNDVVIDYNRSFEIAKDEAEKYGLIIIRGAELTRDMPPGHFNFIFTEDNNKFKLDDYWEVFKEAKKQNAFIFWNHPGWRQPNEIPVWHEEHTKIYNSGYMQGIEIVNDNSFYPLALKWANEKTLTILSNSDIYEPSKFNLDYGTHRAMTLCLVKEKSVNGIKDALQNRRTIAYSNNMLVGQKQFLTELFEKSVKIERRKIGKDKSEKYIVNFKNDTDIQFDIFISTLNKTLKIPASRTVQLSFKYTEEQENLIFNLRNLITESGETLVYKYNLK